MAGPDGGGDAPDTLEAVLDRLEEAAGEETTPLGEIVGAFGTRSMGALISVIGLVAIVPVIGGIPGVSILTGTLAILVALQHLVGRERLWLPDFIERIKVPGKTLAKGLERARPTVRWIDGAIRRRLVWAVEGRLAEMLAAVAIALLALFFYPTALIPWGVTAPAAGVTLMGLAILGRDGALALAGYATLAISLYVIWRYLL